MAEGGMEWAGSVPLFEDILTAKIPPDKRTMLDRKIGGDILLEEIAKKMTNWEGVRAYLKLTDTDEENIRRNHLMNQQQRAAVLRRWKEIHGSDATYRNLAKSFYEAGRRDLAEVVCDLLVAGGISQPNDSPTLESQDESALEVMHSGSSLCQVNGGGANSSESIYTAHENEPLSPGCRGFNFEHHDLEAETHKLHSKFNVLFTRLQESLRHQGVTVKNFVSYLSRILAYTNGSVPLFHPILHILEKKDDLIDVFNLLAKYCSWFNHSLLEDIIIAFCDDDKKIHELHEQYRQLLKKYLKHRVCKCSKSGSLKNGFGLGRKTDSAHLTVKIDRMWIFVTLEHLEEIQYNFSMILEVPRSALYLRTVKEGCVELSFLIPEVISQVMLLLSCEQMLSLVNEGVVEAHCGLHHFSHHLSKSYPRSVRGQMPKKYFGYDAPKCMECTSTSFFHVPVMERCFYFGDSLFEAETQQLEITQEIVKHTRCNVKMTWTKDCGLTFMIYGKSTVTMQAQRIILSKLQPQVWMDLKIPKEHHQYIRLECQKTEVHTSTKIVVPQNDDPSDLIIIVGTREGIDMARYLLQMISDEHAILRDVLKIEKGYHQFIMGPNASIVEMIMEETGAHVCIPPPLVMKSEITVAGDHESVPKAVAKIKDISDNLKQTFKSWSLEVGKRQHHRIMGFWGTGLQEILKSTGVWVKMPNLQSDVTTITLQGPQEKLESAKTLVYEKAFSIVTEELRISRWHIQFIIKYKERDVVRIAQDLVHVEFNPDLENVVLEGPQKEVQSAKELFEKLTEELKVATTPTSIHIVLIDWIYHHRILVKKTATYNIEMETGTSVIVPLERNIIMIEGYQDGVNDAVTKFVNILEKMAVANYHAEVKPFFERFHHDIIIGKQGATLVKVCEDTDTQIEVFKSNIIVITGKKETDVEDAKDRILDIMMSYISQRQAEDKIDSDSNTEGNVSSENRDQSTWLYVGSQLPYGKEVFSPLITSGSGIVKPDYPPLVSSTSHVVHVGPNLPPYINSEHLQEHFRLFQTDIKSIEIIERTKRPQSHRVGVVTFSSQMSARNATKQLNFSKLLDKYKLEVTMLPLPKISTSGFGSTRSPSTSPHAAHAHLSTYPEFDILDTCSSVPHQVHTVATATHDTADVVFPQTATVKVTNLLPSISVRDIHETFQDYGQIQSVNIFQASRTLNYAHVTFRSMEDAQSASTNLHRTCIDPGRRKIQVRVLSCDHAVPKDPLVESTDLFPQEREHSFNSSTQKLRPTVRHKKSLKRLKRRVPLVESTDLFPQEREHSFDSSTQKLRPTVRHKKSLPYKRRVPLVESTDLFPQERKHSFDSSTQKLWPTVRHKKSLPYMRRVPLFESTDLFPQEWKHSFVSSTQKLWRTVRHKKSLPYMRRVPLVESTDLFPQEWKHSFVSSTQKLWRTVRHKKSLPYMRRVPLVESTDLFPQEWKHSFVSSTQKLWRTVRHKKSLPYMRRVPLVESTDLFQQERKHSFVSSTQKLWPTVRHKKSLPYMRRVPLVESTDLFPQEREHSFVSSTQKLWRTVRHKKSLPYKRQVHVGPNIMAALLELHPNLVNEFAQRYATFVTGYHKGSSLIQLEGPLIHIESANRVMDELLSHFISTEHDFQHPVSLFPSAKKRLLSDNVKAYIELVSTQPQSITVCAFSKTDHFNAVQVVMGKLYESCFSSFPEFIASQIPNLFVEEFSVNVTMFEDKLLIQGFVLEDVLLVHWLLTNSVKALCEKTIPLLNITEQANYRHQCQLLQSELPEDSQKIQLPAFERSFGNFPYRSFSYNCSINFLSLIKQHVLDPIKRTTPDYFYLTSERKDEEKHEEVNSLRAIAATGFKIVAFSKHKGSIEELSKELKRIDPCTKRFLIHPKSIACAESILPTMESKYRTQIHCYSTVIFFHGLTLEETDQCWEEIEEYVRSNRVVVTNLPLDSYEVEFLQKKCTSEIAMLRAKGLKLYLPQNKEVSSLQKREVMYVHIEGNMQQVELIWDRISELLGPDFITETFVITYQQKFARMWKKWWSEVKREMEETLNVVMEFNTLQRACSEGDSVAIANFVVFGTDKDGAAEVKAAILTQDGAQQVVQTVMHLSSDTLATLRKGMQHNEINLCQDFTIDVDIDEQSNQVTLTVPRPLADDLPVAETEILNFIGSHTIISKEVPCSDLVVCLALSTKSSLFNYFLEASSIAQSCSVSFRRLKKPQLGLLIKGNKGAIGRVSPLIDSLIDTINEEIAQFQLRVGVIYQSLLSSKEFACFVAKLEKELCVICNHSTIGKESKLVRSIALQPSTSAHGIKVEICIGNLVHEQVDAIASVSTVKDISEQAKVIAHVGGPSIQQELDIYIRQHGRLECQQAVCLGAGNLPCKKVIHAICPQWEKGTHTYHENALYHTVYNILQSANDEETKSIALPALHSGEFSALVEISAWASVNAVQDFFLNNPNSTIHTIRFVLLHRDTINTYKVVFDSKFKPVSGANGTVHSYEVKLDSESMPTKLEKSLSAQVEGGVAASHLTPSKEERDSYKDFTIFLRGPKKSLPIAEERLMAKLNASIRIRTTPLPEVLPNTLRRKLRGIAGKYGIGCTIDERGKLLELSGFAFNVHKATSEIQEAIINYQLSSAQEMGVDYPPEWQPGQAEMTTLFPLEHSTPEWNNIVQRVNATMPTARIVQIKRIQNTWLWERYVKHRKMLHIKNGGSVNEKNLFCGTHGVNPMMICNSEEGFDMQYSISGMWGQAHYFSESAAYSHCYSHSTSDGYSIMLTHVLTGESCYCQSDRYLRIPPMKEASDGQDQHAMMYDTVTGTVGSFPTYIIYDSHKAYPVYVITYATKVTPLHQACRIGNLDMVRLLISGFGANVNANDHENNLPLHNAVSWGHTEMVNILINEFGCDPYVKGNNNNTLLHHACGGGHTKLMSKLITDFGLDPMALDNNGDTPLHNAVLSGKMGVVIELVTRYQCPVECRNARGETPLHLACLNGDVAMIRALVSDFSADVNAHNWQNDTPLTLAAFGGHSDVCHTLITEYGCSPNVRGFVGRTLLHQACSRGHLGLLNKLITDYNLDPNARDDQNNTPLTLAAFGGHSDVCHTLITEYGCSPNVRGFVGRTLLHQACSRGHLGLLNKLFTDYNLDPNARDDENDTPLTLAAAYGGHSDVCHTLITEYGCSPNVRGFVGRTLLHQACSRGHLGLLNKLFTDYNLDPNARDDENNTPLTLAAFGGHSDVCHTLITEYGCSPNVRGAVGRTLLHQACSRGHLGLLNKLITDYNLDPNARDDQNDTPLTLAALRGHSGVCHSLITEHGCSPNESGFVGRTLLHQACSRGHLGLLNKLITDYNLDPNARDDQNDTPLTLAVAYGGHSDVCHTLITEYGCSPNVRGFVGRTLLHQACSRGHLGLLNKLFTDYNLDPNARDDENNTPLTLAAFGGHSDVCHTLITEYGCSPNVRGAVGRTLLHQACSRGHLGLLNKLITDYNLDPNARDDQNDTPLTLAALRGHSGVCHSLITEHGCSPNESGFVGRTLLHQACVGKGHTGLVRMLVSEFGADVYAQDRENVTLHITLPFMDI